MKHSAVLFCVATTIVFGLSYPVSEARAAACTSATDNLSSVIEQHTRFTDKSMNTITILQTKDVSNTESMVLYTYQNDKRNVLGIAKLSCQGKDISFNFGARRALQSDKPLNMVVLNSFEMPEKDTVYVGMANSSNVKQVRFVFKNTHFDFTPTNTLICEVIHGARKSDLISVQGFDSHHQLISELKGDALL